MSEDLIAIETAVQTYLDGLHEGDADKLATVFHPTSSLTYEENGTLTPLPRSVAGGGPRPGLGEVARAAAPRPHPADRPGVADDGVRQAEVRAPPRFFTDYLCLLKVEGRWQVAQKVFATERREEDPLP